MADDKIALSIEIEADKASLSLGELEKGFDSMKERLKDVGRGSAEFKQLSTAMAESSAEIKNIELGFEGLDRDQIASEFGGMAGGIGDVTASLVLMGGENETIEQMGRSIEKAMAISMGFKGVIEGTSAASKLYNSVIKTGVLQTKVYAATTKIAAVAQRVLNVVMKANPIMLIVAAILAAVAAYKLFTAETNEATFAQKAFTEASEEAQKATVKEKIELEQLVKVAKDDTLSKKQRQAAIEELNKLAPDYLGNLTLETINTSEATAAIDGYVASLERKARATALQNKLVEIETGLIDANNKSAEEQQGWTGKLMKLRGEGQLVADVANITKAATIANLEKEKQAILGLLEAENQYTDEYVGNAAERTEADKADAAAKAAADAAAKAASAARKTQREKDKVDAAKQLIDEGKALEEFNEEQARIRIQLIQDEGARKRAEIEYSTQLELEALEKKGQLTFDAEMLIAQNKYNALAELKKVEDDKIAAAEKDAQSKKDEYDKLLFDAKSANAGSETEKQKLKIEEDFQNNLETLEEEGLLTMELETELTMAKETALGDIEKARIEEVKQAKIAAAQEGLAIASQVGQALTDINNAVRDNAIAAHDAEYQNAKKNGNLTAKQEYDWAVKKDKILKAAFEREKKVNIAMGIVNTAQSVLTTLASVPYPANIPLAVLAAIAGAVQVSAIEKQTFTGSAQMPPPPSMGAAPSGPDASIGAAITPVTNTSTILGDQQVTVTETDITSTQNNVSVIEESATF